MITSLVELNEIAKNICDKRQRDAEVFEEAKRLGTLQVRDVDEDERSNTEEVSHLNSTQQIEKQSHADKCEEDQVVRLLVEDGETFKCHIASLLENLVTLFFCSACISMYLCSVRMTETRSLNN